MDKETHDTLKYSSLVFKVNKKNEAATQILTSLGRKDNSEDETRAQRGKLKPLMKLSEGEKLGPKE